ncbi:MAG: transcription termination/antitermination protein NusG, partial [Microbacterium sp.]
MSERFLDDADWAPSAEQSSEEDEAQEGNELAREEHQSDAAEHVAIHIEDEDDDADYSDDDDVEVSDPEADAIVNDALEIDEAAEAEAAAEV